MDFLDKGFFVGIAVGIATGVTKYAVWKNQHKEMMALIDEDSRLFKELLKSREELVDVVRQIVAEKEFCRHFNDNDDVENKLKSVFDFEAPNVGASGPSPIKDAGDKNKCLFNENKKAYPQEVLNAKCPRQFLGEDIPGGMGWKLREELKKVQEEQKAKGWIVIVTTQERTERAKKRKMADRGNGSGKRQCVRSEERQV